MTLSAQSTYPPPLCTHGPTSWAEWGRAGQRATLEADTHENVNVHQSTTRIRSPVVEADGETGEEYVFHGPSATSIKTAPTKKKRIPSARLVCLSLSLSSTAGRQTYGSVPSRQRYPVDLVRTATAASSSARRGQRHLCPADLRRCVPNRSCAHRARYKKTIDPRGAVRPRRFAHTDEAGERTGRTGRRRVRALVP